MSHGDFMNTKTLKNNLIGDRNFYRRVIAIVLPLIIQNTITNVVSLLDNVMVGSVGTLQMSAVAIVNQLIFVFNLCIFGGLAGAGIFSTQYAGAGDNDGVRHCFRMKVYIGSVMFILASIVFTLFDESLISSYLAEDTSPQDALATLGYENYGNRTFTVYCFSDLCKFSERTWRNKASYGSEYYFNFCKSHF